MKKYFSTFFALLCLFGLVLCMNLSAADAMSASLYSNVLRLHVIANSDSDKDQKLKLAVRDGMLELTAGLFSDCRSADEAVIVAEKNKHVLEQTAKSVLLKNGCNEDAEIVIGKERYPEKKYGRLTFPEGEYLSVRVLIGEGKGKNWWCVLFPPLCNYTGTDEGRVLESYGVDKECVKRLEQENAAKGIELFGCNIRLKFLDFFN